MGKLLHLFLRLFPIIRASIAYFARFRGKSVSSGNVDIPISTEVENPDLPGWTTKTMHTGSFEKVGRIARCADGLAIYSDIDDRGFILLNGDIDAVLDGDRRDVRLLGRVELVVGKARLSVSGRALNLAISPHYFTVPLRSVLAVRDGRNRKGALFVGK